MLTYFTFLTITSFHRNIFHQTLTNLKVIIMSVAVELSHNSILKPVLYKFLGLISCNFFAFLARPQKEENQFYLFIILAYSLPQPPRHSWLPEKLEFENMDYWQVNMLALKRLFTKKALQFSAKYESGTFSFLCKNTLLKVAILSKCDCSRQFQTICTGFSLGWKSASRIWTWTYLMPVGILKEGYGVQRDMWSTETLFPCSLS